SRMAHHHAAVRQAFEKARKHCREIRAAVKRIGACKRRIGANAKRRSAPAEAAAQEIDQHSLAIAKIARRRRRAAALAYPGVGGTAFGDLEHGVAHLWAEL